MMKLNFKDYSSKAEQLVVFCYQYLDLELGQVQDILGEIDATIDVMFTKKLLSTDGVKVSVAKPLFVAHDDQPNLEKVQELRDKWNYSNSGWRGKSSSNARVLILVTKFIEANPEKTMDMILDAADNYFQDLPMDREVKNIEGWLSTDISETNTVINWFDED